MNKQNSERVEFRLNQKTKEMLKLKAETRKLNHSEYIRQLIENDTLQNPHESHESKTNSLLILNYVINVINAYDDINESTKESIIKELNHYVRY